MVAALRPGHAPVSAGAANLKMVRDHAFFARMLSGGIRDKAHEAYEALYGEQPGVALDAIREAKAYADEVAGHLEQACLALECERATEDDQIRDAKGGR